jgi:hypothetical protein
MAWYLVKPWDNFTFRAYFVCVAEALGRAGFSNSIAALNLIDI